MHIRPIGETELATAGSSSSSRSSNESADMSMASSSDDSGSLSADEASMEITAAYIETDTIPESSFQQSVISDDSAMDMTVALGGVLDKTAMLPSGQEEVDEDSESENESDAEHEDRDDMTVTMQFTSVYAVEENSVGMDTTQEEREEEEDEDEEEEEEDEEVDMQLSFVNDDVIADDGHRVQDQDENSAMDMTEIYNQSDYPVITTSRRSSTTSTQRRISTVPSPHRSIASPRTGHEYCKIPAADSPKHNLSTASLKVQARRQKTFQSPVKPTTPSSKTRLGESHTIESVTPFRPTSHPEALLPTQNLLPAQSSPNRSSPSPSRKSSPVRDPATPSKVWKSFRLSQGSTNNSPAKRVSVEPSSPTRSVFGSPQRNVIRSSPRLELSHQSRESRDKPPQNDTLQNSITMKQFFDSLDMGFLELSMPNKRKVYQGPRAEMQESSIADIIKATCAHMPYLNSLVGACEELKTTVDEGHAMALENEKDFISHPPMYVSEMASMSSQVGKVRAINAFRLQKQAARAIAWQAYYTWRADRQFGDEALLDYKSVENKLRKDVNYIKEASVIVRGQAMPVMKRRREELLEEIERERKRQKDIEKCDDEEINMLLESIEDQEQAWTDQKISHQKAQNKARELQEELKQVVEEKKDAEDALNSARMSYNTIAVCTKEELNRLARQITQVESLHMWKLYRANLNEIVLQLEQALILNLHMSALSMSGAHITVLRGGDIWQIVLQSALEKRLASMEGKKQPAEVVRFITTAWARIRHFTSSFETLHARFPAEMEASKDEDEVNGYVIARASILLPRRKSKIVVEARCDMVRLLDCKAELFKSDDISAYCVYGSIDAPAIAVQIADCMTVGESAGNLTKAILAAVETFD